jgi:MoaA/NifB/PqqE/SkfB family radical SAM enzyme
MVSYARMRGVERIALSTNGSVKPELYDELVKAGVNDFSISLDACCSTYADKMAGVDGQFQKVIDNIKYLSSKTYVTVGVVFTEETVDSIVDVIKLANDLGVSDIRIISAAQESETYFKFSKSVSVFGTDFRKRYPILAYRLENIEKSVPVRGLTDGDSHRCGLMCDDSMVAGDFHFPCIIHFREGGEPVGKVGPNMRQERIDWLNSHDTHKDPICKANCLDVCVAYNNKFEKFRSK